MLNHAARNTLRLTLFALSLAALAACELLPFPIDLFDTPLEPGGTVVTSEGVYLGATPGALEGTRLFAVEAVAMPTGTGPFPNTDVLGAFIELTTGGDFATPEDAPLLLGLPVPAGVDTARLALAVLMPAETIHVDTRGLGEDGSAPEPQDSWVLIDGHYDPAGGRLVATLTELPAGGITAAVVASGAFGSPPVGASLGEQQTLGFTVRCVGFSDLNRASECSSADRSAMAAELETVFDDLNSRGFRTPKLHLELDIVATNPPIVTGARYVAELHPFITDGEDGDLCLVDDSGSGNHGRYTASLKRVAVCWGEPVETLNGGDYQGGRVDTLRHEYFHAIQYAYGNGATSWFKESTAVAAQDSLDTMVRDTGRGVRDVDVRMNAKPQMYNLQDFWVWLGLRYNLGIASVIPFLQAGGDEAALDAVFASNYPQLGGLAEAYWAWTKNQSFEKVFALGGNGFATLCGLDTNSSGNFYAFDNSANPGGAPPVLSFDFAAPPADLAFSLPPLTSRVYQLDFGALPSADYATAVMVTGGAAVESKFYDPADSGTNACVNDADSNSLPITVVAGQDETRLVLIANTSSSSSASVTVSFAADSSPTIEIVSPLQNGVFDENDLIDFQALASGFTGANPDLVNITWTYELDGVPTTIGTSDSGEILSRRLCDGSYSVTATARNAGGPGSAAASVSFVVNDLGASGNPPTQCRPTITVLEPSPGQTFAVGQTITLRAAITDDDPTTDDPLYPIIWRDGGPSGSIVGMGLTSSTKLGEGVHQIHVSYGVASDTVTVTIGAGNPPSATITFPSDDLFIPWTEVPNCDDTLTLLGVGDDSEDGPLTGGALTWRYRVNGGSQFLLGTGSPIDLNIRCGNTYEVTLTAEDSDGLQDNDTVIITVQAPPS